MFFQKFMLILFGGQIHNQLLHPLDQNRCTIMLIIIRPVVTEVCEDEEDEQCGDVEEQCSDVEEDCRSS